MKKHSSQPGLVLRLRLSSPWPGALVPDGPRDEMVMARTTEGQDEPTTKTTAMENAYVRTL